MEVHLVGHSAGAIFHAGVVSRLVESGLPIESCTLWAPACTVDLFNAHYRKPIESGGIKKFNLYVLSDKAEQDDNCARIYNKSLLYLVSDAFEARARIPGFRDGEPILGMSRWLDKTIMTLFKSGSPHHLVVAPNSEGVETGRSSQARHHGDFDDDANTVMSTFASIIGGKTRPTTQAVNGVAVPSKMAFHRSSSALRDRRTEIDARTTALRY